MCQRAQSAAIRRKSRDKSRSRSQRKAARNTHNSRPPTISSALLPQLTKSSGLSAAPADPTLNPGSTPGSSLLDTRIGNGRETTFLEIAPDGRRSPVRGLPATLSRPARGTPGDASRARDSDGQGRGRRADRGAVCPAQPPRANPGHCDPKPRVAASRATRRRGRRVFTREICDPQAERSLQSTGS
jgi:hypothetical protein